MGRRVIVIGAGPAGLTAAWELVSRGDSEVTVLEKTAEIGGLSRTVVHEGNRIDIGGHRFFSKSDRVMRWWLDVLPQAGDPEREDRVFLLRQRRSRIYYLRQLFRYPITLSLETLQKLGLLRSLRIGLSYLRSALLPIRPERNLEDFFINRFGRELYRTFFKSYTEKVWGVPCRRISPEWGGQRVKGLSILRAVTQALTRPFRKRDLGQKGTETSLIEQFLYPKLGPGQMWQEVTRRVCARGGQVLQERSVVRLELREGRVAAVHARAADGTVERYAADYVLSSMPVQELVAALDGEVPANVREVAAGLVYRDFITVGVLLSDLRLKEDTPEGRRLIRDNWIYIQEEDVRVGRLQIFNNWSPYLVADRAKVWVGLEYFCNEGDELWRLPDAEMLALATSELAKLGMIETAAVLDGVVIRQPKAYPAYFGSYPRFSEVARFLDGIPNLFPIGRNGMHKYNNQDHSMLTAMVTVDAILAGSGDKTRVWSVNTEEEYHEERASS
ncbi:MAG TPA: NAD(P)/FAD-dependent oxidoreductase [Vicinamibacteria bacterium]|nr:NAD(P)/FAD-dependent oxidoreductase [Vicinamibacteria bacterium]